MSEKKVLVIGSGPGGSAFAALMAHAGHRVTLLEKNRFPGGKCSSLSRNGYILDTGVHMFGRGPRGPFGEITRILGEGPRWSAAIPSFTLNLSGRGNLEMCSSVFHPISVFNFIKGSMMSWQKMSLVSTARKSLSALGLPGLLSLGRRFNDRRCPLYGEQQDLPVRDFITSLTDSDDLLRAIHSQVMLTMAIPWHRASQGEFAYILASITHAAHLCYPIGGSGEIPASFLRALGHRGGEAYLGRDVSRIEVEEGRVKGVTTGEGDFFPADLVVSNAGIKRTVEMAGRYNFPPEYLDRLDGLRESEAFIVVKFTLDRKITSMRTPCLLHLPDLPPESMFDYLEDGTIPTDLFLFITAPGIWDPLLVPPGKDVLIVGVPAPSSLERSEQCERLLDMAESMAVDIFPEISGCVIEKQRVHTSHISRITGRSTGECIGLAQEVGQSGIRKPDAATPIDGLYLVGSDSGGRGIGTECAAESALYLYNMLKG